MVGPTYFLPWPTIFQLPHIREKMGRESDLIKMTLIPLLLNVNTFFFPFFFFFFPLLHYYYYYYYFPFYGFFVWRWTLLLFSFCLKSFFFLALSLVSLNLFLPGFFATHIYIEPVFSFYFSFIKYLCQISYVIRAWE